MSRWGVSGSFPRSDRVWSSEVLPALFVLHESICIESCLWVCVFDSVARNGALIVCQKDDGVQWAPRFSCLSCIASQSHLCGGEPYKVVVSFLICWSFKHGPDRSLVGLQGVMVLPAEGWSEDIDAAGKCLLLGDNVYVRDTTEVPIASPSCNPRLLVSRCPLRQVSIILNLKVYMKRVLAMSVCIYVVYIKPLVVMYTSEITTMDDYAPFMSTTTMPLSISCHCCHLWLPSLPRASGTPQPSGLCRMLA